MKVVVTGVGGGVGQSILKSLQGTEYTAVGVDGEVLATGLYGATRGYRGLYAREPGYVQRLIEICRAERGALLFPGLDAELPVLAREATRIREAGTLAVVSSPEVVAICDDKLETSRFLREHGFPTPQTVPFSDRVGEVMTFPFVIKPMKGGARSRGVFVVRDQRELQFRLATLPVENYVAQEQIEGDEYTCGSLNLNGSCLGTILMRRVLRDGDTYKAFVEKDPNLDAFVHRVLEALRPFGPCNVQLRRRDGVPYVFEFNARCSGTTYCRTLAGFNEPRMIADLLLRGTLPTYRIRPITILRYWKELVVENDVIARLSTEGAVSNGDTRL
jgi:carbamoyl-phosphate synthase large subunit